MLIKQRPANYAGIVEGRRMGVGYDNDFYSMLHEQGFRN